MTDAGIELAYLTIAQASEAVAAREISPLDLVEAALRQAERAEPVVHSFALLQPDQALDSARSLTDELMTSGPRSSLHGIPLAVKDVIDVAGLPTKAGSRVLGGDARPSDATVVARLRSDGAVVVGKSNAHEFAYGAVTPPTRNPWDIDRIPGGSSGGSAAAIAAGESLGALGTDTAGSIRIPAAFCGVSGFVPRANSLPKDGIIPLSWTLDRCGPLARTAQDLATLYSSLSAGLYVPGPRREDFGFITFAAPSVRSLSVELDSDVEEAVESAAVLISAHGGRRVDVDLPPLPEWDRPTGLRLMAEALVAHQEAGWYPDRADGYGEETLASLQYAEKIPAARLIRADRDLDVLRRELDTAMAGVDLLVLPTTPTVAPTVDAIDEGDEAATKVLRSLTRIGGFVNATQFAAATVPCGRDRHGLPIGVQFIGSDEHAVLGVAMIFQNLTDFHGDRARL